MTEELAQEAFPDNEYIIATHTDKNHIHCHIIVNSVSFVNGKMLHFTNNEYARLKDRSNEIAAKYGYSTLDFRKPSADRIKSEERRVILKGGTSWKEELREVIAEALKLCNNMDEFEKHLSKYGVAKVLGCSLPTARRIMQREDFPLIRVGKNMKVSPEALREWMKNRRV